MIPSKNTSSLSTNDIFAKVLRDLKIRTSEPKYPIGIEEIDDLIWGLHRKELLIIGARPSNGKTSLALFIAWQIAKQNSAVIFDSLEMSKESIVERILCMEFGLSGWKLRKGDRAEIQKAEDLSLKFNSRLINSKLEIIDDRGKNIKEIEQILVDYQPDFLFIDHAQKISQKGYGNKYEALAEYANTLQSLAIEHDCGIVLNSQINRGGEFLKGSGDLEEAADTFLKCEWKIKENPEHNDPKEYEIDVKKQRHGPCSFTTIDFDAGSFRFSSRNGNNNSLIPAIAKTLFSRGIDNEK